MTEYEAEKLVFDYFVAGWSNRLPLVAENGPTITADQVPLIRFVNNPGSPFTAYVSGAPVRRTPGTVVVTVFVKGGIGSKVVSEHAEAAGAILEYQDIFGIKFRAREVRKLGLDPDLDNVYLVNVLIPYYWDNNQ